VSKLQYAFVCILLLVIAGAAAAPLALRKTVRPSFEYKIVDIADQEFDSSTKQLGDEGWEIVFARRASGEDKTMAYEIIFKRPK
jgi:hypothetical protein